MKQICFRVDASNSVGMGHLMECITLADFFYKNYECNFIFLVNDFAAINGVLSKYGYECLVMHHTENEDVELESLKYYLQGKFVDIIVCNLLNRSDDYYRSLQILASHSVIILDDEIQRQVPGDVVINFSITQDPEFYSVFKESGTRYCIGPAYMPHSDEFYENWCIEKTIPEECKTIFVNQGGSDPFGLTAKIIRALELLDISQTIYVIMGDAISDKHRQELESMQGALENRYIFEWGVTHTRMLEIMEKADLAITAAGNTLYELAIFGVPSIVICHHERHQVVADKFAERSAVINLGVGIQLHEDRIADSVIHLLNDRQERAKLSTAIKKVIDGKGCRRISGVLESIW